MKRLLVVLAFAALPMLCGCVVVRDARANSEEAVPPPLLSSLTVAQLEEKRAAITAQISAIEREVELKRGLPMGVFISDDRTLLEQLEIESKAIHAELARRGIGPEGEVLRAKI